VADEGAWDSSLLTLQTSGGYMFPVGCTPNIVPISTVSASFAGEYAVNMTRGTKYFWAVRAINAAGLVGSWYGSHGIKVGKPEHKMTDHNIKGMSPGDFPL